MPRSFDIESTTTGQLQTLAALDYETQTDYEVMVIATDDGAPRSHGRNHGHYQRYECLSRQLATQQ